MSAHAQPYDYGEAKAAIERASIAQRNAENAIKDAFRDYGAKEQAYRMALAQEILKLRADGVAITVAQDLAKGTKHVADLRFNRDVAEGIREAATSAVWRHTADRRELEQLVDWSMRVAPDGQHENFEPVRAAA
jgi:hypothetical protein